MSDSEYSDSSSDNSSDTSSDSEEFLTENKLIEMKNPFKIAKNITDDYDDTDIVEDEVEFDYDNLNGGADDLDNAEVIDSDEDVDDLEELNENTPKKLIELSSNENYDDSEDDEDDENDENYLQKFNTEITKNYINEYHPECLNHNYDEISKMTVVVRNSNNIIVDPFHKTIPFLTKYEKSRVLGQRAKQIESGAKPFVNVPENIIDGYIIAELELKEKNIPFIIKRPIPGGGFEYWKLSDLEIIM
jgi:DNA-directed RNA polymerase I, II, and III subunit RPABC2